MPEANFSLYIQSALETKAETSWGVSPEYLSCTFQARLLANLNLLRSCRKGDKFWKPVWSQFPVAAGAVWVTCTWVVQTTPHPYQQAWPPVPQESVLVTPKHLCPAAQKPPLKQPLPHKCQEQQFQRNAHRSEFSTCLSLLLDESQNIPYFIKWSLRNIKMWSKK